MKQKISYYLVVAVLFICVFSSCKSSNNEPNSIEETSIFTKKYTSALVLDAQRNPAYPVANEDWKLSGFQSAIDPDGGNIDWGTGRYVQFEAVVDNTSSTYSITDDLYNTGTKYTIMLKLYESNGALVKIISDYGQIIGIGDKGFMYVAEGFYGMFFPKVAVSTNDIVTYKPTTATVTKLSELYK